GLKARSLLLHLQRFKIRQNRGVHGLLFVALDVAGSHHQLLARRRRRWLLLFLGGLGRFLAAFGTVALFGALLGSGLLATARGIKEPQDLFVLPAGLHEAFAGVESLGVVPLHVEPLRRLIK